MLRAPRWAARLLCLGSCLLPGRALHAQGEPLTRGQEVRIFVTGVAGAFEGRLIGVNPQSVTVQLENGTAFTLQTPQIQRAEVLGSRTNVRRGAVIGGGVGLAAGVAWAIASRDDCLDAGGFCADPGDHFEEWKLVVPALAGAAAGALVGHYIQSPSWVPGLVPGPTAGGGVGVGWRLPVGPGPARPRGA